MKKAKLKNQVCCYCGATDDLSIDHLVPRSRGGKDTGDNLVYACRKCNSAKNNRDLMVWYESKDQFPPVSVLRRYLKLAYEELRETGALDLPLEELGYYTKNYRIDLIPEFFPPPGELRY